MAGPFAVIVAGAVTVWLAISSQDGLVADDYYKKGLAINQTLARTERAKAMDLSARVRLTSERIEADLHARHDVSPPPSLTVVLSHPTRAGLDQSIRLNLDGATYAAAVAPLAAGRWQISVEDDARSWRLTGALRVPDDKEIRLGATGS